MTQMSKLPEMVEIVSNGHQEKSIKGNVVSITTFLKKEVVKENHWLFETNEEAEFFFKKGYTLEQSMALRKAAMGKDDDC